MKSYLVEILKNRPDDWREYISKMWNDTIKIKEKGKYAIFNYVIDADFSDPVVCEARGIILDTEQKKVVCWPFRKFMEYDNKCADVIDWKTARVQEKIDGSIIKLWFDDEGELHVSTNSEIDAADAIVDQDFGTTFMDLVNKCTNFHEFRDLIDYDPINKNSTYMFELTTPENKVVVKHYSYKMTLIGIRSNITGEEVPVEAFSGYRGICTPIEYELDNLETCINYVKNHLNTHSYDGFMEGFVVVDDNFNRIKIKSPIYLIAHNILSERSKEAIIKLIWENNISNEWISDELDIAVVKVIKYYDYKVAEEYDNICRFVNVSRKIYKQLGNDRAKTARIIGKNKKYSQFGFAALDNDKSVADILHESKRGEVATLCKFIPRYEITSFSEYIKEAFELSETVNK